MRYATGTLTWTGGQIHPVDDVFARDDDVAIEAIQYVSPGPDGQYVELLELSGALDRAAELLEASPDALEFDVTGADGRGVAYVQCRSAGLVPGLLATLYEHEIALDWPIRYVDDGERGLKLTVFGTGRAIRRAAADVPADVKFTLERTGEYDLNAGGFTGVLTERQLDLLELAVQEGYYELPRRTTQRELASKLDLATGTVSERLQRIEAKLVRAAVE